MRCANLEAAPDTSSALRNLQQALEEELDADTTVLVKGSRFMKMERVVAFAH